MDTHTLDARERAALICQEAYADVRGHEERWAVLGTIVERLGFARAEAAEAASYAVGRGWIDVVGHPALWIQLQPKAREILQNA